MIQFTSILKGISDLKKRLKTMLYVTKLTMLYVPDEELLRCLKENEEAVYVLMGKGLQDTVMSRGGRKAKYRIENIVIYYKLPKRGD